MKCVERHEEDSEWEGIELSLDVRKVSPGTTGAKCMASRMEEVCH